ncbi:hypothetical protein NEOLEDRAFT_875399 [Neolentinus lepideus HHB14362 ss-1]|uniref:Uncharacterized protein n=1 Tax=Neolentinus lepideus HHB14362 ss-1 TaxID=1314782 RepID=A0A165P1K4_9AGAM|nr:hypothetical protein NEOLEDRAFT_875399 [Neolentinus lepideus HHB14362 ss-1]
MRYKHGCGRSPGALRGCRHMRYLILRLSHCLVSPQSTSRRRCSLGFGHPLLSPFTATYWAPTLSVVLIYLLLLFLLALSCILLPMAAPSSQSSPAGPPASATETNPTHHKKRMSWRKPVPKFLPSPPPSPPPSSPANRLLTFAVTATSSDVPPLPVDWRETIERVLTKDRWQRSDPIVAYGGGMDASVGDVWTRPISPTPDARWEYDSTGFFSPSTSTLDFSRHLADISERHRNIYHHEDRSQDVLLYQPETPEPRRSPKHLHRTYRPPTPPLPTHYKKRRLPDDDAALPMPLIEPYRRVYPDTPTIFGHRDTVLLHSLPPSTLNLSCATFPRTHSFAGWDVPVPPVVLPGPSPLKKPKSSLSLTKTVVRDSAMQPSRLSWFDLLCVRRKGTDRTKTHAQETKRIDLPGLPPVSRRKRLSMASTVELIERRHSTPFQAVSFLWDRIRCWSGNYIVKG